MVIDVPLLPELVFGIAGPMGVNVDLLCDVLATELRTVRYESTVVKVTDLMMTFESDAPKSATPDFFSTITYKIEHANALCRLFEDPSVMAKIAVREIVRARLVLTAGVPNVVAPSHAFIIRQLKRPQEVELLRRVYGRKFILISAYGPEAQRREILTEKLQRTLPTNTPRSDIAQKVEQLIDRDAEELGSDTGQQLRDTFHLGDVFVNGIQRDEMTSKINRFIEAFFGRNDCTPNKDEYGMYAAKSASLRSADLARQVGAAIFSKDGEIITQGCNEVPKALGGTYWDDEMPDNRDIQKGLDPNDTMKKEILRDVLERLQRKELLSDKALSVGNSAQLVDILCKKPNKLGAESSDVQGALSGSPILDLTEFGRIVHAEMCAICDAARLGKSIKGATLYCTTFPCHNCAKHLIAAGITRVVYIEPYPKSKATALHSDEISVEEEVAGKVAFVPFLGISPFRYRDIFQKGRRKNGDGTARTWYAPDDSPKPMLDPELPSYFDVELAMLGTLIGDVVPVVGGPGVGTAEENSVPSR